MSLVPTREDEAFSTGYRQASEAGGIVMDHLAKRLREVEADRDRWKANHKDVVETKRGTDARLKVALAGLQEVYTVCGSTRALAGVRQIAGEAFEVATKNLPRAIWQSPQGRETP